MPNIECQFILAGSNKKRNIYRYSVSTRFLDSFSHLFAETLLLRMDRHYQLYTRSRNNKVWTNRTTSGIVIGGYTPQLYKVKAPAVSGNIGEAIIMPSIASSLGKPINNVLFARIRKPRTMSPDYIVHFTPSEIKNLWKLPFSIWSFIPDVLPVEAKAGFNKGDGYPAKGLKQLHEFWKECSISGDVGNIGYGIVASINIIDTNNIRVCFYLFIKKWSKFTDAHLLSQNADYLKGHSKEFFI
ncbi:hypothetical protein HLK66_03900 [Niallia circulans]|uniref:hypothetical protein n=2 Tax=Niallia circulans TaxID=1397 RepID=UPI00149087AE|nr:hypothetical protein [Niallia circulans]QJX60882.1 hypothetical protein HLK66_03900 [Niallia circulans]